MNTEKIRPRLWRRRRAGRLLATTFALLGLIATLFVGGILSPNVPAADAADLGLFRPGNIISDQVFFNSGTMNESQIQSFLSSKVSGCSSGPACLKNYTETTRTRPADRYCSGTYTGGNTEPASRIIAKVAAACGINPQVLIVTLQKEQGLVTNSNPSSRNYRSAMGFGCPDTADCDTQYYGFFNQVYSAARQFKVYGNSTTFTWYAPGRTANVLFNPDGSCGSSPVYIENQATANLYYYTPYQPNGAALAAGYGMGNGCSAYGNRNFFNYFTDWFGSTQRSSGSLVQAVGRGEIYLIAGAAKHHIADYNDYLVLASRLGAVSKVQPAYIDSLYTAPPISRYVHEPSTGTLYLLQSDGTKHRFVSGDSVTQFGYNFTSFTNLEQAQLDAFTTGADVGNFFRIETAPEAFKVDGATRRYIPNSAAWNYTSAGVNKFVAQMSAVSAAKLGDGPAVLKPNILVRGADSGDVYLTTGDRSLIHIPSFGMAGEFGATSYSVLPAGLLAKQTVTTGSLGPFVTCGQATYFATAGRVTELSGDLPSGWSAVRLADDACTALPISAGTVSAPLFIRAATGGGEVYQLDAGTVRHVRSYSDLIARNGARPLSIATWASDTVNGIGIGGPILSEGSFVQFTGQGEVYRNENGLLRHITQYATLVSMGGGKVPAIEQLNANFFSSYTIGDPYP